MGRPSIEEADRTLVAHPPTVYPEPPRDSRRASLPTVQPNGITPVRPCIVAHCPAMNDEELLAQAEEALTEIKVNQGLSDRHASVLAALRIRLKGSAGKSLEEMLEAAGDLESDRLSEEMAKAESKKKPSLDDLLAKPEKKRDWPSG